MKSEWFVEWAVAISASDISPERGGPIKWGERVGGRLPLQDRAVRQHIPDILAGHLFPDSRQPSPGFASWSFRRVAEKPIPAPKKEVACWVMMAHQIARMGGHQ